MTKNSKQDYIINSVYKYMYHGVSISDNNI